MQPRILSAAPQIDACQIGAKAEVDGACSCLQSRASCGSAAGQLLGLSSAALMPAGGGVLIIMESDRHSQYLKSMQSWTRT